MSRSVARWTGRLAPRTAKMCSYHFEHWLKWLRGFDERFADASPDDLVKFQKGQVGDDRFIILDLLQEYVKGQRGRANYKRKMYTAVRSFFMHNRAELPHDKSFKIRADVPKVVGSLTVEELKRVLETSNPMYRAFFLCAFQAGMGMDEALYWNGVGLEAVQRQLRAGTHPLKIDLPGRKKGKGIRPYYTFLGRDAVEALQYHLHAREDGAYIFLTNWGSPLSYDTLHQYWMRRLRRLGLIEAAKTGSGSRYGKNPHELRDLFKTRFHKSGADLTAADFFMGHIVDPLEYDKAFRDVNYARRQYRRAERWLNILSEEPEKVDVEEVEDLRQHLEARDGEIEKLKRNVDEMTHAFRQWQERERRRELTEKDKRAS